MGLDPSTWGQNPYIKQQADALTNSSNQNLMQNVMPGIGQGAQQAGMYGSSRQGVAQGVAAANAQTGLDSALGNMYSTAYGQDQNAYLQNRGLDNQAASNANQATAIANQLQLGLASNALQGRQIDNSYNLGLGGIGLQYQNQNNQYALGMGGLGLQNQAQNQSFYTNQRGQDLQQMGLGASLYGQGNAGNIAAGQGMYNTGQQFFNAPLNSLQSYSGMISPYTGLNNTETTNRSQGGGAAGALGGALGGYQMFNNLGFGQSAPSLTNNMGGFYANQDAAYGSLNPFGG